jgi:methylthioribose-1-phosphate isomerase
MVAAAVKWVGGVDGFLELIDQRRLPGELVKLQCRNIEQLYNAIKTLTVRGAPAIGVAGAYGLVLAMQKLDTSAFAEASVFAKATPDKTADKRCSMPDALECLKKAADYLGSSRPTGVNLFWALDRIKSKAEDFVAGGARANLRELQEVVLSEANAICQEDVDMCRRIGENGEKFIKDGAGILTHCNAGALATAGQGTALSVMFEAHKKGKRFKVYVDETRPLLQGARLTAWELKQAEIDVVVICDNMAGWLMKQGKISAVITGADRIAANGDAANKIGTYSLSVLAREHGIPFYIAAPSSTFDLSIKSGDQIPIEQRAADEVRFLGDEKITPDGVDIYNPAFDITEARDITAIITERGVIEKPAPGKIAEHFRLRQGYGGQVR